MLYERLGFKVYEEFYDGWNMISFSQKVINLLIWEISANPMTLFIMEKLIYDPWKVMNTINIWELI